MSSFIYPDYSAYYEKTSRSFSSTRDAEISDIVYDKDTYLISSVTDLGGGDYQFNRTYLVFDMSVIRASISALYLNIYPNSSSTSKSVTITYGAYDGLLQDERDYPNYIINGEIDWLGGKANIIDEQYNEFYLRPNIAAYDNRGFLVIGIIDDDDFDNVYKSSTLLNIDSGSGTNPPYLRYVTSSAGYSNTVLGVSSSSISTVNGTSISNISKINVI